MVSVAPPASVAVDTFVPNPSAEMGASLPRPAMHLNTKSLLMEYCPGS